MAVSKRDRNILVYIGSLLIVYALWVVGIEPVYNSYVELNDNLAKAQATYKENQTILLEAKTIEAGYKMVEAQFPRDDPERDASEVFSEEVVALVRDVVGRQPKGYQSPTVNEIKGATGYQFLILPVIVDGPIDSIAKLFKAFNQKGYLIQSATITAALDKEDIGATIELRRIVKIPTEDETPALGKPGQFSLGGRQ